MIIQYIFYLQKNPIYNLKFQPIVRKLATIFTVIPDGSDLKYAVKYINIIPVLKIICIFIHNYSFFELINC